MHGITRPIVGLVLLASLAACSDKGTGPTPPAEVASVTIAAPTVTLAFDGSTTLTATPRDASGEPLTGHAVSWSSSAASIATVNSGGVVTAVSPGTVTITATSDGKSGSVELPVQTPTCGWPLPTGRLEVASDCSYSHITNGGWRITLNKLTLTIVDPSNRVKIENWGVSDHGVEVAMAHENLNGKHVKDFLSNRRSHQLPDGSMITIDASVGGRRAWVTIYDTDQTHRLDAGADQAWLEWSSSQGQFGEAQEPNGETSRIFDEGEGFRWENIYTQEAGAGGVPGPKVPGVEGLAETVFANPGQVKDYFDDPRLGHT